MADDTPTYKSETEKIIKEALSEHIGTEPEDINDTDLMREELGLNPIAITDFLEDLRNKGFAVEKVDLEKIETVGDLVDLLDLEGEI